MAIINNQKFEKPFVVDVLKVNSNKAHQYDLPIYYLGQMISLSVDYAAPSTLRALGSDNGYQHLYLEGKGQAANESTQFSWLSNNRFYTLTTASDVSDEVLLTRIGASDPEINLRRDPAFMLRRKAVQDTTFASVIESHGSYNPVTEYAESSNSNISALGIVYDDDQYTAISIKDSDSVAQ